MYAIWLYVLDPPLVRGSWRTARVARICETRLLSKSMINFVSRVSSWSLFPWKVFTFDQDYLDYQMLTGRLSLRHFEL